MRRPSARLAVCAVSLAAMLAAAEDDDDGAPTCGKAYDADWSKREPGYGVTWMYFPDGNDGLRNVSLVEAEGRLAKPSDNVISGAVSFRLQTLTSDPNPKVYDILVDNPASLDGSSFNPNLPTYLIAHGWSSSPESKSVKAIKTAYKDMAASGRHGNFITVDWSALASAQYLTAVRGARGVGRRVADLIKMMTAEPSGDKAGAGPAQQALSKGKRKVAALRDIHLVGHSLGAHVMGYAGKFVSEDSKYRQRVGRITGLDPAKPWIEKKGNADEHLDVTDADFVDVIHTSSPVLGFTSNIGHADFHPNGGTVRQRGCCVSDELVGVLSEFCSHSTAYKLFAASINTMDFIGRACPSWTLFKNKQCLEKETAVMGHHASTNATGSYYFYTAKDGVSPKGVLGASPKLKILKN